MLPCRSSLITPLIEWIAPRRSYIGALSQSRLADGAENFFTEWRDDLADVIIPRFGIELGHVLDLEHFAAHTGVDNDAVFETRIEGRLHHIPGQLDRGLHLFHRLALHCLEPRAERVLHVS